ncbi:MAG: CDP-glucose 4,6-dehydratase [Hyphomonadaceae bacterium]|nr:CDP-glucose 4,6-dehydratase [Hyphomonadaceae bacterium]
MVRRVDPEFWRGRRVVVTGHTGFKGAWLCLALHRFGARVHGLALPPESPSLYAQARIGESLAGETLGDLADQANAAAITTFEPEIVFHFAAQSLVRAAYLDPVETFRSNVMATVNVLDVARRCASVRTVFVTTTDKVYLNREDGRAFQETDPLGGYEPYGASKAAAEMVLSAYRASYFERGDKTLLTGRAGNVIGGGDWSRDRIIPDIVRAVMAGEVLAVRNPRATRPWQWVMDALEGYLLAVEVKGESRSATDDPNELAWNFGPTSRADAVRVEQLCAWAIEAWPERFSWRVEPDSVGALESGLLMLDPSKAVRDFDWSPQLNARAAVATTLDWYARVLAGEDASAVCDEHLALWLSGAAT